ncbi:MAG: acetoin dehydrogenase dihydrolipoyllysine-residue acetyltransferase subunit [Fuerstiella sp.]|nr:acetoin dehydrogenase dihydrolipoyllysine-residue acetyltransferase subunit [Fuerstiella sp.]
MGNPRIDKLIMPKWGFAMTQGRIGEWKATEGSVIAAGDEVLEIETEKAIGVVESPISGTLRRLVAQPDQEIPVGGLLAVVADPAVPEEEIDRYVEGFVVETTEEQNQSQETAPESIEVGSRNIQYLKLGEGGPPLVLVHGFTGNLNNWLFNHATLSEERTVYALDLPGHGLSSKDVGDGSFETLTGVLCDWMDAMGLPQVHLAGHSLGGGIAMDTAFRRSDRLLSCTLISSAGLGPDIDVEYLDAVVRIDRRKQLRPWLERLFADREQVTRQSVDDLLKFKRVDGVHEALTSIVGQLTTDGQQTVVFRDRLDQVEMPVQVIWGESDQIIPCKHTEELPDSWRVRVFEDCGHMVQMEAAVPVNRLISDFLRDCD